MSFVRFKESGGNRCSAYGTGGCCYDLHFDGADIRPMQTKSFALCGVDLTDFQIDTKLTSNKHEVNCKECLELIHS